MQKHTIGRYILLDTEATGFYPHKHGLIECAAIALDDQLNILDTYHTDIHPPATVVIDPEALKVNGFTLERIEKGISYSEFIHGFVEFINKNFLEKPIAVAQFYPFDFGFLKHIAELEGFNFNNILGNDFVDTKSIVNVANMRARLRGEALPFPVTSLSKEDGLKDTLVIRGDNFQSHTAMGDVLATLEVLKKLMEKDMI